MFDVFSHSRTQQVSAAPVQWSGVSMPADVYLALSNTFVTLFMPAREELKLGQNEPSEGSADLDS
jgi:hypothetical protein